MARISSFLEQYPKSATRAGYRSGVLAFLSFIYDFKRKSKKVSEDELIQLENLADRYFVEDRDHEQDLIAFSKYCGVNLAPTTGTYYITSVKEFFIFNNVELTRKQERNLKNKITRGGAISREEDLTPEMLRGLLTSCDLMLQTLILIMVSSGLRISEALSLTLYDVKISPDNQYAVITLRGMRKGTGRGTKNAHGRTTFINREAVELLNRWLDKRGEYLESKKHRNGLFTVTSPDTDTRIFPCGKTNAENILRSALKRAGMLKTDEDTNRATLHYHLFRKFFVTQMTYGGVGDKYIQFFVGHLDNLDRAYNKPTTDKLLEFYLKGEPHLRIYDESAVEVAKTKEEIKDTKDKVRDIQLENLVMKSKLQDFDRMEQKIKDMEQRMRKLEILDKVEASFTAEDRAEVERLDAEELKKEQSKK